MSSDEDSSDVKRDKFKSERAVNNEDTSVSCNIEKSFGPALPPHLMKKINQDNNINDEVHKNYSTPNSQNTGKAKKELESQESGAYSVKERIVGPEIPAHLIPKDSTENELDNTDPDYSGYGPSLSLMADPSSKVDTFNPDFCKKQEIKESSGDIARRESWMLELPPERAAQFGLGPRQFKRKVGNEKDCDRSGWLETPNSKGKESNQSKININDEKLIKQKEIDERNRAMELLTKKIEKKKKREESLLEIHRKKMKKKAKKEAKKRKKEGKPIPRRPFDRNIDLQVNRFDESQKRAVLKKAQLLNDRFSSGETKFL